MLERIADDGQAASQRTGARTWWIDWFNLSGIIGYHVLAVLAFTPWFFRWWGVVLALVGHYTIGLLGISLCYHRLLTHRAFACPKWLEYSLAVIGIWCSQDSPAYWVAQHRCHHQHTDQDQDPHSPVAGFFWAHMGWVILKRDLIERRALTQRYARDLLREPFYAWLERHWILVSSAAWPVFFAVGFLGGVVAGMTLQEAAVLGVTVVLWGVVVRTVITWHVTWGINSVSHLWGYRNYDTPEGSRNNVILAALAHGEWHNNHHAKPSSAMHGHQRWEIDPVFWVIRLFAALGLASNIVLPGPGGGRAAGNHRSRP